MVDGLKSRRAGGRARRGARALKLDQEQLAIKSTIDIRFSTGSVRLRNDTRLVQVSTHELGELLVEAEMGGFHRGPT